MLHQLALEMTRDRGEAMVTSLQKGLTIGQKTMAKHSDGIKREMEHLRGQIERQSREMVSKIVVKYTEYCTQGLRLIKLT